MSRKGNPPGGATLNHDHSRTGEGGDQLNPDAVGLTGDEPFDFGDMQVEFRSAVGTAGALVFRDTANNEDRFFIEIGDVARFANQALRMPDGLKTFFGDDQDYSMEFDTTAGANGAVVFRDESNNQDRLELRVGDVLRLSGQNLDLNNQDLEDAGTTIWDSGNSHIPAPRVQQGAGSGLNADTVDGQDASQLGGASQQDLFQRLLLGDDFADNTLRGRDSPSTTASELATLASYFRPNWQVEEADSGISVSAASSRVEVSSSGGSGQGGIRAQVPGLHGEITMMWNDVAFSVTSDFLFLILTDRADLTVNFQTTGNSVFFANDNNSNDQLEVVNSGTGTEVAITNLDWSVNHEIDVIYRPFGEAELVVDGSTVATESSSTPQGIEMAPGIVLDDQGTGTTVSAASVEVDQS